MEPYRTAPGGLADGRARKLLRAGRACDQGAQHGACADAAAHDAATLGADALKRQSNTRAGGGKVCGDYRARSDSPRGLRGADGLWAGGVQVADGRGESGLPALSAWLGVS